MAGYEPTLERLEWATTSSSIDSKSSSLNKPKKSSMGIFGSVSRRLKGIRAASSSKSAEVPRSTSSSQRSLPPFSLKHFSSLKKRQGEDPSRHVSRKAATVRGHVTTERTTVLSQKRRRTSMGDFAEHPALAKEESPLPGLIKPPGPEPPTKAKPAANIDGCSPYIARVPSPSIHVHRQHPQYRDIVEVTPGVWKLRDSDLVLRPQTRPGSEAQSMPKNASGLSQDNSGSSSPVVTFERNPLWVRAFSSDKTVARALGDNYPERRPLAKERLESLSLKQTHKGLSPRDSNDHTFGTSRQVPSPYLQAFELEGIDKQHIPDDTDGLSIFTDIAGSIDLGEDISGKYWSTPILSLGDFVTFKTTKVSNVRGIPTASPGSFEFPSELEGGCSSHPHPEEGVPCHYTPFLPPNFLRMALGQPPLARKKAEPELDYLRRIKEELRNMTLETFDILVDQIDPEWDPTGPYFSEFVNFQLQAGILIGKCEIANKIFDRLNDEQRLRDEASVGLLLSIHDIVASGLEEIPPLDGKCLRLSTPCFRLLIHRTLEFSSTASIVSIPPIPSDADEDTKEDTIEDTKEDAKQDAKKEEPEFRGIKRKVSRALLKPRVRSRRHLRSQKTPVSTIPQADIHPVAAQALSPGGSILIQVLPSNLESRVGSGRISDVRP
ncbi:hypothetical protein PG989_007877 [Apiospora arundinis]